MAAQLNLLALCAPVTLTSLSSLSGSVLQSFTAAGRIPAHTANARNCCSAFRIHGQRHTNCLAEATGPKCSPVTPKRFRTSRVARINMNDLRVSAHTC